MTDPRDPGHPVGPEIDSTQNMTDAAPGDMGGWETGEQHAAPEAPPEPEQSGQSSEGGQSSQTTQQRANEMLRQLQQMIDQLTTQAGPPMREIAAKAAELAAVAAQRAGPLAVKAAEKTQVYGERFAAKSKEMAADLRRQEARQSDDSAADSQTTSGADSPQT
jgi:hypothetical protein